MNVKLPLALLFAACMLTIGCHRSNLPETVSVQGRVTWQGKPLPSGTLKLSPSRAAGGAAARPAVAVLNADGTYKVSSYRQGDGLVPGEYQVILQSYVNAENESMDANHVWRIPERYGNPAQNGLRLTVPADARGPITFDIDVKP